VIRAESRFLPEEQDNFLRAIDVKSLDEKGAHNCTLLPHLKVGWKVARRAYGVQ
jgi:hypothetical protein